MPVSEFFEYLNKSCLPRIRAEIPPEVRSHLDAALKFVANHLGDHDAAYLHLKGLYEKERWVGLEPERASGYSPTFGGG